MARIVFPHTFYCCLLRFIQKYIDIFRFNFSKLCSDAEKKYVFFYAINARERDVFVEYSHVDYIFFVFCFETIAISNEREKKFFFVKRINIFLCRIPYFLLVFALSSHMQCVNLKSNRY